MKEIPLTQGKVALVDDADYDSLMAMGKWYCDSNGYAARSKKYRKENGKLGNRTVLMHRVIMQAKDGTFIDHRDTDKLNNQKSNLRECTKRQNCRNRNKSSSNSSSYKGVSWNKEKRKWVAQIRIDDKVTYLGQFVDLTEAAKAYNAAALEHYGEFARLNDV